MKVYSPNKHNKISFKLNKFKNENNNENNISDYEAHIDLRSSERVSLMEHYINKVFEKMKTFFESDELI